MLAASAVLGLALAASVAPLAAAPSALAAVEEGDLHYARRAEGARGAVADPAEVQLALQHYRRALVLDPAFIPAQVGLLRGLFFRGGFCGESGLAQKATFEEAKRAADEFLRRLEARGSTSGPGSRLERLKRIPDAAALYFWSAVSWGQWSVDHKLAAAWQGAAGRIRDLSEAAIALDPGYAGGSPYMILGRLHAESPKIPLLTGWISRKKAIECLRRAHQTAPENTPAQYFLADALLNLEPQSRAEALQLLETCAKQEPRPEFLVEDRHYAEEARARLADPSAQP